LCAAAVLLPLLGGGCPQLLEVQNSPAVRIVTSQGEFSMVLKTAEAPAITAAFTGLVEQGYYNATVVHRVVAGARVEIGGFVRGALIEKPTRDPIANEAPNALTNVRGAIAMAHGDDPASAAAQFFINLRDNPDLDASEASAGYAVFGRVIAGLDVADQIGGVATEPQDGFENVPVRDIIIRSAARTALTGADAALTGVTLETTFGTLVLGLDAAAAPNTVANFLQYVDDGFYANTLFHHVVAGATIQGGGLTRSLVQKPVNAAAPNESLNGLKNVRGAVAATFSSDFTVNTAAFLINVSDNPEFDARGNEFGYTVFAEIIDGIEVVDQIAAVATSPRGSLPDVPTLDITIERMELYEVATSIAPNENGLFSNAPSALSNMLRDMLRLLIRIGVSSLG
jgi:cyclophilin family peptidyl-prolyl cis-trans isomerase